MNMNCIPFLTEFYIKQTGILGFLKRQQTLLLNHPVSIPFQKKVIITATQSINAVYKYDVGVKRFPTDLH